MKYFHLVWAALFRRKTRTLFTLLSVLAAFLLFGLLDCVRLAFANAGGSIAGVDRLITISKVSFTITLPKSLLPRIQAVPGVAEVSYANWFGGIYQEPKNFFANEAVADNFLDLYPEWIMPEEQHKAFRETRTGAIVGASLAQKFHWKVGDKIPLQTETPQVNGNKTWTFDIVGIVDDANYPGQAGWFLANYAYLDEASASGKGTIDRFLVRIKDPDRAAQIGRQIDRLFANSAAPTRTSSEKSRSQAGLQFIGDVNVFTHAIVGAVFFMLLFVTGNTMLQSIRERVPEFAVLKTSGFTDNAVLWLVIAESVLLCLMAALVGLVLAKVAIPITKPAIEDYVTLLQTSWADTLRGFGLALVVALISSLYPAWQVRRLSIVTALSRR